MDPQTFFGLSSQARLAMVALEQLDREACSGCGHPLEYSTSAEAMSDYRAKTLVCFACREVEKARENAGPGALVYAEHVWDHRTDTQLVDDLD